MKGKTKALVLVLTLTIFLSGATMPALAEEKPADNMQILQEKIKADKKLLVSSCPHPEKTAVDKQVPS